MAQPIKGIGRVIYLRVKVYFSRVMEEDIQGIFYMGNLMDMGKSNSTMVIDTEGNLKRGNFQELGNTTSKMAILSKESFWKGL